MLHLLSMPISQAFNLNQDNDKVFSARDNFKEEFDKICSPNFQKALQHVSYLFQ